MNDLFCISTVQSVMCYCLTCWGGRLSVLLDRVVQSASKTIGTTPPKVNEFYETCVMKKTRAILKVTYHQS